jgi:AcrR family transcriptional regulator
MAATTTRSTTAEDTRRRILDEASRLIAEQGAEALTMRRLSEGIGASTIVLYTHFRDKSAIVDELYREGFERLRAAMAAVPQEPDALAQVRALGRAYRQSAVANPTHYQIMFTRCVPGFTPSNAARESSDASFALLAQAVARCMTEGLIAPGNAKQLAVVLWGTLHGLISLELFDYLPAKPSAELRLEQALDLLSAGLQSAA